ncbi:uncharacterized protein BX664DRAFT_325227 [Halteromyces radiatus]|uniref:uncharacterized protein n=1 Tax=Halteromyces radiatus TaxID=101107 RepID=UPI002220418A|nr:uncharacterized protein BX664DRAFT_325227 [Halteromyces radiatus]KAI8096938.1 hypothetical protein BX664DRAFT_325227 [Halteromyces radiatus]
MTPAVTAKQAVRVLLVPSSTGAPSPWEITFLIMTVFLAIGFIASVCLHTYLWRKNRRLQRMIQNGLLPPTPDMLPMGKQLLSETKLDQFPKRTIQKQDCDDTTDRSNNKKKRLSVFISRSNDQQPSSAAIPEEIDVDENACVICLEPLDIGQDVRQLPCHHEYHCHCIGMYDED